MKSEGLNTESTTQSYHDEITALYDAYYADKKDGVPTPPERRIQASDALIERYINEHTRNPPNAILSRLATYILLDDLSDSHPDKMAREEYPIMSYGQTGRYFERNGGLKDEPHDHEEVIGYSPGMSDDGKGVRNALLNPESAAQRAEDWRLFIREVLTEREAFIIERTYEDGATQAEIAKELGVSQQRVATVLTGIYDKLRKIIDK